MGPRGPRPLARSACNYVWAGEGGRARSTRSRSSAWRTRVLRTGQFLYTQRISPTSCIATMAGWLLHTICFYGPIQRATGHFHIRFHRLSRTADTSIPFNKKSFERGEHARVYESYVCSVPSPSPPSLLVCAHFHHGRISRGSRCEGGRASIRPAAQTGVAYPINANIRGEQASKNLFGVAC